MDRLWAMEVFVKVVEANSMSRAATYLDLANASVTSCIRNLETHLGVTLLRRSTRHINLTDEGAAFYNHCRSILGQVAEAEAAVSPSRTWLRGMLRAEFPIALGQLIVGPALIEFASRHPDLKVLVNLTNSVESLIRRGVDVAVRMDEVDDGDLVARWLLEARHVICASPDFLAQHGVPTHPNEIDLARCIGFNSAPVSKVRKWSVSHGDEHYELTPSGNLMFNSSDALLHTAARGGGMIYVLDILARDYIERGQLMAVLTEWQTARQTFYAVYPQSRFVAPKVRLFVEFLSGLFGTRPDANSILVPSLPGR